MKKLIAILLLIALVISFCACGKKAEEEEVLDTLPEDLYEVDLDELMAEYEAEKKKGEATPEQMYGMIDQLTPVDGVYMVWNEVGVQNMADHPEADFQLLCNVDMKGATLRPIGTKDKPFTGSIKGQNNTISNFTITESADGYMGFLGYSKGTIVDITLDGVTMVADAGAKYIGGVVGYSENDVTSTTVNGTILVENAADGAVCGQIAGYISGDLVNSVSDMDITYTAAGAATIGGCAGIAEGIRAEFTENYGFMVISGSNKTVGLMAGSAKDVDMYNVAFLGERNEIDGKLCTDYFGKSENAVYEKLLVRDNTPYIMDENVAKLRDKVVDTMYQMATYRWTTTENLYHDCHCQLTVCHGIYKPGMVHVGIPYNHYSTTLTRFEACFEENHRVKDWLYDLPSMEGYDTYFGNDCSGAVQVAWWTVSSTSDVLVCASMQPIRGRGTVPVGEWPADIDIPDGQDSYDYVVSKMDINEWYEAYAQVRRGDAYFHLGKNGNHTRMAQEDPVIVRDENGMIDGDYSYIVTMEQGAPAQFEPYYCTWRYDYKYSFKNLILGGYLPITVQELASGEMAPVDCKLVDGTDGKTGMTLGTIESNYNIEIVTLQIEDSEGNVVFDHTLNPNAQYRSDLGSTDMGIRNIATTFNLAKFATPLSYLDLARGESYNYTVTTLLSSGDEIVVKEGNFTNGNAA